MAKGRFLNQKLGKRTTRRLGLLKSAFRTRQAPDARHLGKNPESRVPGKASLPHGAPPSGDRSKA